MDLDLDPNLNLDLKSGPGGAQTENHRSETIGGIAGGPDPESSSGSAQKPDLELDLNLELIFSDVLEISFCFHTCSLKSPHLA